MGQWLGDHLVDPDGSRVKSQPCHFPAVGSHTSQTAGMQSVFHCYDEILKIK
jgi:hypothetical protein